MDRIQKIIAASGVMSRRRAEELILAGHVTCNGQVCQLGQKAGPEDVICIHGQPLPQKEKNVYIMLNKPRGYVTTLSDEKGRPDAASLVSNCGLRVYPVGRLDMDSEGLLIFTNDGDFAHKLMHPSHVVDKTYLVWVSGYETGKELGLKEPIELDGYLIRTPEVSVKWADGDKAQLQITIHEGRNRQIRRMCDLAGLKVKRLMRICEGGVSLGDLPLGKWRYLTEREIRILSK